MTSGYESCFVLVPGGTQNPFTLQEFDKYCGRDGASSHVCKVSKERAHKEPACAFDAKRGGYLMTDACLKALADGRPATLQEATRSCAATFGGELQSFCGEQRTTMDMMQEKLKSGCANCCVTLADDIAKKQKERSKDEKPHKSPGTHPHAQLGSADPASPKNNMSPFM